MQTLLTCSKNNFNCWSWTLIWLLVYLSCLLQPSSWIKPQKQDGYIDRFFYILAYQIYAINIHDQTKLTLCLCSSDYLHMLISATQTLGQALCSLHPSIFLYLREALDTMLSSCSLISVHSFPFTHFCSLSLFTCSQSTTCIIKLRHCILSSAVF